MNAQTLAIRPRRLEDFIESLVNLHWQEPAPFLDYMDFKRFMRFGDEFGLFDPRFLRAFFGANVSKDEAQKRTSRLFEDRSAFETGPLRFLYLLFSAAWVERNANVREWAWISLRSRLARAFYSTEDLPFKWKGKRVRLAQPPEEIPVESAFRYLLKHHGRVRTCPNADCPAAHFFAKRHTQRYCSEACAQSGEREAKRRWWAEHGSDWRKQKTLAVSRNKTKPTQRKKGR